VGLLVGAYHGLRGEGGKGTKRDEPRFEVIKSGYQDGESLLVVFFLNYCL
jgi:hypothetical protein